jgi:hypothetical protein
LAAFIGASAFFLAGFFAAFFLAALEAAFFLAGVRGAEAARSFFAAKRAQLRATSSSCRPSSWRISSQLSSSLPCACSF